MKQINTIIGDEPCPSCRAKGKDTTGNHLIIYSNGGKYCNRCKYIVRPGVKSEEEPGYTKESVETIINLPSRGIPERRISEEATTFFDIKITVSEEDGSTVTAHYYPYYREGTLCGYKKRIIPKKFLSIGSLKGAVAFFGQHKYSGGGKRLLITGGELDAAAGWDMLKQKYPQMMPQVVSLPKGEASLSAFKDNIQFISSYENIIIATDMDDAGRKIAKDIASLLGRKALIMTYPEKDISDMRKHKREAEFIAAFYAARPYRPESVVTVEDVFEEAIKMPTWGLSFPWPSLTRLTYGIREKECYYLGAGVGINY